MPEQEVSAAEESAESEVDDEEDEKEEVAVPKKVKPQDVCGTAARNLPESKNTNLFRMTTANRAMHHGIRVTTTPKTSRVIQMCPMPNSSRSFWSTRFDFSLIRLARRMNSRKDPADKDKSSKNKDSTKRIQKQRPDRPVQQSDDENEDGQNESAPRQDVNSLFHFLLGFELHLDHVLRRFTSSSRSAKTRRLHTRPSWRNWTRSSRCAANVVPIVAIKSNAWNFFEPSWRNKTLALGWTSKSLLIQIAVSFDYHHKNSECLKPETWTR